MNKLIQIGYFYLLILSLILLTNSQVNNEVDIWHTNEFVALSGPKNTPFKQCFGKKRKLNPVYCNRYYECDAIKNFDAIEIIYDEKFCEPETHFDEITLRCQPIDKVECYNRIV